MHVVDLSHLTPAQLAEYDRRYKSTLALYSVDEITALKGNAGQIARVASNLALRDVRDRRQPIWRRR